MLRLVLFRGGGSRLLAYTGHYGRQGAARLAISHELIPVADLEPQPGLIAEAGAALMSSVRCRSRRSCLPQSLITISKCKAQGYARGVCRTSRKGVGFCQHCLQALMITQILCLKSQRRQASSLHTTSCIRCDHSECAVEPTIVCNFCDMLPCHVHMTGLTRP